MSRFVVLLMIVAAVVLTGCGKEGGDASVPPSGDTAAPAAPGMKRTGEVTVEDVKGEVKDVMEAATAVAGQEREKLAKKFSAWKERLDNQAAGLEAKGKELDEKAREEWQAAWAKVQEKQKSFAEKNDAFQAASAEGWSELKEGVDGAAKELKEAISNAVAEFDRLTAPPPEKTEEAGSEAKPEEAGSAEK